MLRVKDSYFADTDEHLRRVFYELYFAPLLAAIPRAPKLNASSNALLSALSSGRVIYKDGVFSGSFNASISMNLASFAKFDRHTKKWYGRPPSNVLASAIMANDKRARLMETMNRAIDDLARHADETIKTLSFSMDLPLFSMNQDVLDTLPIGIRPTLDARTAEKLRKDYNESLKLNIVNENDPTKSWTFQQTHRLRDMVERYQTSETNESLTDMIMKEWDVSANKANFLARQETSLFFSKFSMNRASSAGVRRYRWSTSHDIRVRDRHKELDGTIHSVDDPPVVDLKTGRRAHPGEDYNCRCAAIWVLE